MHLGQQSVRNLHAIGAVSDVPGPASMPTSVEVHAPAALGHFVRELRGRAGWSQAVAGSTQDAAALAQARDHLSVLRGQVNLASDRIPVAIARSGLFTGEPVDLNSARMVRGVGRSAWLASSSDGRSVCEISDGALACPPVEDIARRGLSPAIFTRAGEPIHVSGVASDEVRGVDVVLANGTVKTVSVEQNLFTLDTTAIPRKLRWVGPGGPEVFAFPQGVFDR